MTWLHSKIVVNLKEAFGNLFPWILIKERKFCLPWKIIYRPYGYKKWETIVFKVVWWVGSFPFSVLRMFYLNSNTPSKIFYCAFVFHKYDNTSLEFVESLLN